MIPLFTAQETRRLEQMTYERGISYLQMMENAGRACCETLQAQWGVGDKRVCVICGKGGNGGDGFVLARHLQLRGAMPFVLLLQEPAHPDAQEMYRRLGSIPVYRLPIEETELEKLLMGSDIIVDAVYGIGMRGELPPAVAHIFSLCEKSPAQKAAIDIPSGVRGDDGSRAEGAFLAQVTIALGCYKIGHFSQPGSENCGKVVLRSFGEEEEDRENCAARAFTVTPRSCISLLPPREPAGNKGTFGTALNIAGSRGMSGAAILSSKGALRCGVGLLRLAVPKSVLPIAAGAMAEPVMMELEESPEGQSIWNEDLAQWSRKASAILVGCGLGTGLEGGQLMQNLLACRKAPLIVDADGINILAKWPELLGKAGENLLFTPHPLEFSRLTGKSVEEIQQNRAAVALEFAQKTGAVLLLKGSRTLVASPDGRLYVNRTGNTGLSKGGSGDVLAGMILSFAAQGVPLFESAVLGSCLHGTCADMLALERSVYGILPSDIPENLPFLLKRLEKPEEMPLG